MTVKELIEELQKYNPNFIVMIPDRDFPKLKEFPDTPVKHVAIGTNEFDNCIFLDAYEEW